MGVTLLGPQRRPTVDRVVRAMDSYGPVATITAGWQERETDDIELDEQLDGRSVNLRLWGRWGEVQDDDPEFAAATRRRRDELLELRHTYLVRLRHAMAAVQELGPEPEDRQHPGRRADDAQPVAVSTGAAAIDRSGGDAVRVENSTDLQPPTPWRRRATVRAQAQAAALDDVRRIDAEHVDRLDQHNAQFIERWQPHARDSVGHHRAEIAAQLEDAAAFTIAGGHIGVLLALLHLFAVDPPRRVPIVAWSAGAMALTELVVLYHDRTVQGPSDPEVYGRGLSVVKNVVAMPHARDRLLLNDANRMSILQARFAPARCLVLDAGARLAVSHEGDLPATAIVLAADGHAGPVAS